MHSQHRFWNVFENFQKVYMTEGLTEQTESTSDRPNRRHMDRWIGMVGLAYWDWGLGLLI